MGGTRPKESVLDENGYLCVAKIPSCKDDYDIALWELFAHVLAAKAGIYASTGYGYLDIVDFILQNAPAFGSSSLDSQKHFPIRD